MWDLKTIEKECYHTFERQIKDMEKQFSNKRIAIWGAGVRGIITGIILEKKEIKDFVFIDNDPQKQGKRLKKYPILSLQEIEKEKYFIFISIEYGNEIEEELLKKDWINGRDFYWLKSRECEDYIRRLKMKQNEKKLLMGASIWHTVPLENCDEMDCCEILENKEEQPIKILGMTCLGMKNMYYSICLEAETNPFLKQVILVVSWETLTEYHHLLPRTQKLELIKKLHEYALELYNQNLSQRLAEEIVLAEERAGNFILENRYSPNRIYGLTTNEKLKNYADMGIMKELNVECEEVQYLEKIIEYLVKRNVKPIVIVEPVNQEKYAEIYGGEFFDFYAKKLAVLRKRVEEEGAFFYDASYLLEKEEFSSINLINEAMYTKGREQFADLIIKFMNTERNFYWPATSMNVSDYNELMKQIENFRENLLHKQLYLFGAGIRGCIFKKILEKEGIHIAGFIDTNLQKFGGYIENTPIYNPYILKEIKEKAIIINTVENGDSVNEQVLREGYCLNSNFFDVHTDLYKEYLDEFKKKKIKTLIIGDCGLTTAAIHESEKKSLGELLKEAFQDSAVLAMHGMGMRSHYNILNALVQRGVIPETIILMVNFDTFTGKQHLLPRSQHMKLLEMIINEVEKPTEEFEEYIKIVKERNKNYQVEFSGNRSMNDCLMEQQAKIYLRLNYMYRLQEENEGILYLKKILAFCRNHRIKIIPYIPPVNYELAEKLIGDSFKKQYDANLKKLNEIVLESGFTLLDMSYSMNMSQFCQWNTPDETLNYAGRQRALRLIIEEYARRKRC
ncbi:MAG: hypothetical protein ACOCNC_02530 [Acetivibrio ethanolgignens]